MVTIRGVNGFIDPSRINPAPEVAGHAGRESLREHIDFI
jgi:hypothetical protein